MAIEFTPREAVESAIASVEMAGFVVSAAHRRRLEQVAAGKVTARALLQDLIKGAMPGARENVVYISSIRGLANEDRQPEPQQPD